MLKATTRTLGWLALAVILVLLPHGLSFSQQEILVFLTINVLLVTSYRLLTLTGEWSLGHAVIMGVGAYASALITKYTGLFVPLCMVFGALTAAAVAYILSFPLFRMKGFYFLIGSFAAGEIIRLLWKRFRVPFGGPKGLKRIDPLPNIDLGPLHVDFFQPVSYYYFALLVVAVCLWLMWRVERSPMGLTFHAVHWQDKLAEASGVNVRAYRTLAFVIASGFAGLSGALLAHYIGTINPGSFEVEQMVFVLTWAIVGGTATFYGPILGVVVLTDHQRDRAARNGLRAGPAADLRLHPHPVRAVPAERAGEPRAGRRRALEDDDDAAPCAGEAGEAGMSGTIIAVEDLTMRFGGLTAVDDLRFEVAEGAIHGLIGPNGAGKTTTFNMISGFYTPTSGRIVFDGAPISGLAMHEVARRGVVRTFQHSTLFNELSVIENVLVGTHMVYPPSLLAAILGRDAEDRAGGAPAGGGIACVLRPAAPRRRAGPRPAAWPPAGARHGDRHRREAARRAARRAVHRHERRGDAADDGPDAEAQGVRRDDPARRARHAGDHGPVRPHHRDELRPAPGRGLAGRDPAEPEGDRGLSGGRRAMLLEIDSVSLSYNKVSAMRQVSMQAPEGGIVTIIGANGAGKTSTLRAISGLARPSSGEIRFAGTRIDRLPPEKIVALGIAHVPEGRRVFAAMTVEENLRTGAFLRRDRSGIESDLTSVYRRFPRLKERRHQLASTMSGGEQQMLAIGRALMAKPKLLLLDEPSMGLAPVIVEEIARIIKEIAASGVPVILVEQNAELALSLADYAYVLETGSLALEGAAKELHENEHVRRAYLGI